MFWVGQHGNENIGVWWQLLDIFSESDVVIFSLLLFVGINVKSENLMTLFGKIDGHGETHVAHTDEADFGEWKDIFSN